VIDYCERERPGEDVAALVRAAGSYVRASDDLRPRVLEAARLHCRERRAQRWIRRAAMILVMLTWLTLIGRDGLQRERSRPLGIVVAAGFDEFFAPTAAANERNADGDWRLFEAFQKLRHQQAQVLRCAL
jgi:hypothetical protein